MWLHQGRPRGSQHRSYFDYKSAKRILIFNGYNGFALRNMSLIFDQINLVVDSDYTLSGNSKEGTESLVSKYEMDLL